MSHRLSLRTAVLAAVAVGAVLAPAGAAFASDSPKPVPTKPNDATKTSAPPSAMPSDAPRGGVAAGNRPAPSRLSPTPVPAQMAGATPHSVPRGGVAAGERPAGNSGDTTALAGSAAAAVLLAGAGTFVVRRRSAANRGN